MARTAGSSGEKTTRAIVDAAVALFAERGYAAVSMRAIAERVGIQVGALYNHFSTKQDVLVSVMLAHMNELLAAREEAFEKITDPVSALEAFTRFHVRYHMDLHDKVLISFMELRSLESENFKSVVVLRQRYEHQVKEILIAGQKTGDFDIEDAHVSAMAIIAMLTGVTTWFKPDGRLVADEVEESYVSLVFKAVGVSKLRTTHAKRAV